MKAAAIVFMMVLALLSMIGANAVRAEELSVYPPLPDGQFQSDVYDVTVWQAGQKHRSYVYQSSRDAGNPYNKYRTFTTDANHWTSFSFSGEVRVEVKLRNGGAMKTAIVRPRVKQIAATVADNTVSFTLDKPGDVFVEIDARPRDPLFIFANPLEVDPPSNAGPGVIYFGPGVTDLGAAPLTVESGQTVYLAGGAYVKGRLQAGEQHGGKGITVRGRGVLSGVGIIENRGIFDQIMIDATHRSHGAEACVEGIVVTDSPGPCVFAAKKLTAENVKLLSWSRCSDGIGGGTGTLVKNCFLKVNDDNIHFHVSGMQAIDNTVWLQAAGSALQMGWNETRSIDGEHADGLNIIGDDIGHTRLKRDWLNNDAVALMDIHGRAIYRNIVIENIHYECRPSQLFGVRTKLAEGYSPGLSSYREGRGGVDGMILRNITAEQMPLVPSVFDGNGVEPGSIRNVTFENIRIADQCVTESNAADYVIQRGKTDGFHFEQGHLEEQSDPPRRNTMKLASKTTIAAAMALLAATASAADFYVAPNGADANPGSQTRPFASLDHARDAARAAGAGPNRIVLMAGEYFLAKPLDLDARDNGLTIEPADGAQATLYGGKIVYGWRRDGDQFWCADVAGVKEGTWDFRSLIVNGRMPERARVPETGTLLHRSIFDAQVLPATAGYWSRQPTMAERTAMEYDPKDIAAGFDIRNAELRIYHMWDESLVGIAGNDAASHTFKLASPAIYPPGAFGIKKYIIFNTREGLTHPGQWQLDRTAGKVVYWPLPGEEMTKTRVIAPVLERVIHIAAANKAPPRDITLRGFAIQCTTTPLKPAGFGAMDYDGAIRIDGVQHCTLEKLDISNVGGLGIRADNIADCQIRDCQVHHIGAGGVRAVGTATLVAQNHIHHVGLYHPSATALMARNDSPHTGEDKGLHIYRNEIHDGPYCGMIGAGSHVLIEENLVYRIMREMQDGAAIYGNVHDSIIRGNVVRDVVKMGEGFGVSSYYLDETSDHCVVERNVSIGVERPIHNHLAHDLTFRNNVFIADANMVLSFPRTSNCTVTNNTFFAPGKITVTPPNAVKVWENNLLVRNGVDKAGAAQPFTISDAMPPTPAPGRRTAPFQITRVSPPPVLDGEAGWEKWPAPLLSLDREPSRWSAGGASALARVAYDDTCLYVAAAITVMDPAEVRKGAEWGKDDGMEISLAGAGGTFVLRGFADGTLQSLTDAGAPPDAAARLAKAVRFVAKPYGKKKNDWKSGWRAQWAIPFEALGIKPAAGEKMAFNLAAFRSEDQSLRCLEGTLAEPWRLDQAATLQLK